MTTVQLRAHSEVTETVTRVGVGGLERILFLTGEHDASTADALAQSLALTMGDDFDVLVVDLGAVEFMAAATIGVLMRAQTVLSHSGRALVLRSPSRSARRVLDPCHVAYEPGAVELRGLQSWVKVPVKAPATTA